MARSAPRPLVSSLALAFGVAALTMVTFVRLVGAQWNHWDDDVSLLKNPLLHPPSLESIQYFWKHGFEGLYIPVTQTVWTIVAFFARFPDGSLDARPFHTANVAFHALNAALVFFLLRTLLRLIEGEQVIERPVSRDPAAVIGALLFGLHPVQAETVGWIVGLRDILATTFALLAAWAHFEGLARGRQNRWRWAFGAATAFLLALLSKPSVVALPVFLAVTDRLLFRRTLRASVKDLAPWLFFGVVVVGLNAQFQLEKAPYTALWARPFIAGHAIAFYLEKLVYPYPLLFDYGLTPDNVLASRSFWVMWLVPAVLFGALARRWRRYPGIALGAVLFLIALVPVTGLVPFAFQYFSTVADHYLYLPLVGVGLAAAWILRRYGGRTAPAPAFVLTMLLATISWRQASVWRDPQTLFGYELLYRSDSAPAHSNLALVLAAENHYPEAIEHLRRAVALRPTDWGPVMNLGTTLIESGATEDGLQLLYKAAAMAPTAPDTLYNLGIALMQEKRRDEAILYFRRVLAVAPDHPLAAQQLISLGGRPER